MVIRNQALLEMHHSYFEVVTHTFVNILYILWTAADKVRSDARHGRARGVKDIGVTGLTDFCRSLIGRSLVQKLTLAIAIAALVTIGACKKTGEGQYEVQKPVVGTETDTVNTPSIETGTVKDTVTITRPTVDVKSPEENKKENK